MQLIAWAMRRWTQGLMRGLLREGGCTMRIDGPYGEAVHAPEWTKYRTLVVIAGGIGVRAHIHSCLPPQHAYCVAGVDAQISTICHQTCLLRPCNLGQRQTASPLVLFMFARDVEYNPACC
jgi:hypothetical protein